MKYLPTFGAYAVVGLTGEEVARELLSVIQGKYGIANDSLLAIMQDCASVNNLAISIVRVMYP